LHSVFAYIAFDMMDHLSYEPGFVKLYTASVAFKDYKSSATLQHKSRLWIGISSVFNDLGIQGRTLTQFYS